MSVFRLTGFGGKVPRISSTLLKESQAQVAENCNLSSGQLQSWRKSLHRADLEKTGAIQTIYKFGSDANPYWLHWNEDVDVVRGPIAGDLKERTYFTGLDVPRVTNSDLVAAGAGKSYPNQSYKLGVPAPSNAPTLTKLGTAGGNPVVYAYVYTWVTGFGEEGPPSQAQIITLETGEYARVEGFDAVPADHNITTIRVYRSSGGAYLYAGETAVTNTYYDDLTTAANLGEAIPSIGWDPPPADLRGITLMDNGIMVGFSGNLVCFSEPYLPHAWPKRYQKAINYTIIALGAFKSTVVVATDGLPYEMTGFTPESMRVRPIKARYPCIAKRGLVSTDNSVAWPTPSGLYSVGAGGRALLTNDHYTREEWLQIAPETIRATFYDGKYIAFYDNGDQNIGGFVLDTRSGLQLSDIGIHASAIYTDTTGDRMYYAEFDEERGLNEVHEFNAGVERQRYAWRSKRFDTRRRITPAAVRIIADYDSILSDADLALIDQEIAQILADNAALIATSDVGGALNDFEFNELPVNGDKLADIPTRDVDNSFTFKIYGDKALVHVMQIRNDVPARIPGGYTATLHEFEVSGVNTAQEVRVATTISELTG